MRFLPLVVVIVVAYVVGAKFPGLAAKAGIV